MFPIASDLAGRLYRTAAAERWGVPPAVFAEALARSVAKSFGDRAPSPSEIDRYLSGLHLPDLALACACAEGHDAAWEHFILEYRPALYRAADAIDPTGGARELADSLYAELYGLKDRGGERQTLFRYFHGRSSLATWLRSVLSQRHVDRIRSGRRLEPLPEEESPAPLKSPAPAPDPDRPRFVRLLHEALAAVLAGLDQKDRFRLGCYYAQEMTLAAIGRLTGEHEATVSRQLARIRRAIRQGVEQRLRESGMGEPEIDECFAGAAGDAGALDLSSLLGRKVSRKNPEADRSTSEGVS